MGTGPLTTANVATGLPPAGDQANAVVQGTLAAAGAASPAFAFWGSFNVSLWGLLGTQLTIGTAGQTMAAVASATNLSAGQNIQSSLVPPGTTIGNVSGTTITLGGITAAQLATVAAGVDAGATFAGIGAQGTATVALERSFDGGSTWLMANVGGGGAPAEYIFDPSTGITNPVSFIVSEPEKGVLYRLVMLSTTNTTVHYRFSTTGGAATTWSPSSGVS